MRAEHPADMRTAASSANEETSSCRGTVLCVNIRVQSMLKPSYLANCRAFCSRFVHNPCKKAEHPSLEACMESPSACHVHHKVSSFARSQEGCKLSPSKTMWHVIAASSSRLVAGVPCDLRATAIYESSAGIYYNPSQVGDGFAIRGKGTTEYCAGGSPMARVFLAYC